MTESGCLPVVGDSKKKLGVVVAPATSPDVTPDENGNVHPPTAAESHGMSTAVSIQALPAFRRPTEWGGTETSASFKVWAIDTDNLGSDLVALQDSSTHVTIGPARVMSLAEYRAALAATQSKWILKPHP
jgi:hypothetical protein